MCQECQTADPDPDKEKVEKDSPAEIRADFMRRWFAIAVSVGFATTVVEMAWLSEGRDPNPNEQQHLARLLVALIATLFSWEGYLLSISKKPLHDIWRFIVDVGLVFVYLVLLITSALPHYWLWLHAITFLIYILWDNLTIIQYPKKYIKGEEPPEAWTLRRAFVIPRVYVGGLYGKKYVDRGPVITVLWSTFFFLLYDLYRGQSLNETFVFAALVFAGLVLYRVDKSYWRSHWWGTPVALFSSVAAAFLLPGILL